MSDFENDLRNMLDRRADGAPKAPGDWQDLIIRMSRRNRRARRLLSSALALVLIVGPIAGFAIARNVTEADAGGRVTAGGPGTAGLLTTSGDDAQRTFLATGAGRVNLQKLFRRTTGDNIAIRAFISRDGLDHCQGDGWCPPATCFPAAMVTGEISTDAAVGFADGAFYDATSAAVMVTGGGTFGAGGEGAPARWTIVQTSDKVAKVRVSYAGGGRDEMEPVDGVVVLAALTDVAQAGGTVEGLDRSGAVIGTAKTNDPSIAGLSAGPLTLEAGTLTIVPTQGAPVPLETGVTISPDAATSKCVPPPPALPAAGEQPVDAGAAKADIEQTFATAYDGGLANDNPAKAEAVEDSASLAAAITAIRNGTFAEQVRNAGAKVTEVVFTSPTEASVRYDITMKGASTYPGRIGQAKLLDGRWKVARATVCADIEFAGAKCPAP